MASQGDQVPLLSQQGEAYEEPPDHRFAIDEETAEAQAAAAASNDQQDAPDSPKYPYPPSAAPPSYREATGKSLISVILSRLFSSESMPDVSLIRRSASSMWLFICRFWPTSRFAQVGFFMLGLWLLVIVSGPAFEEAGPRAGSGYTWSGIQELANNGPGPISGDGHPISLTNWTLRSCQNSIARHGQVLCTSTSRIELDIPPPKTFNSNEALFIFADPPREDHLGDNRGKVPGTIDFELVEAGIGPGQIPQGKVHVVIDAEYEQNKLEVFEKSTIVKMAARRFSQGIGIYTFPLPARYQRLDTAPLTFHIRVLIPSGARIPSFRTDASAMTIRAFERADTHRELTARDAALVPPKFGRFTVRTGDGDIRTGSDFFMNAVGLVHMRSSNGNISLSGEIHSQEVRVNTLAGNVRLEEGCHITASREASITTNFGSIALHKNSYILSGELLGKALNGAIQGGVDGGIWRTNKTLQLHTTYGAIQAAVEVVKPTNLYVNRVDAVFVDVDSKNGRVDVAYVGHDKDTTLHSTVKATLGEARVKMHPNFEGLWTAEGTIGSSMTPPAEGDPRHIRSFDQKGSNVRAKLQGDIWFDSTAKRRKEAQSSVSSTLGKAQMIFA